MNFAKKLFAFGGVCLMALGLTSCGVSQADADKINEAAKKEEYYTVEKLVKSYGDPTYDLTLSLGTSGKNGAMIWVKGCKTSEEVEKKWDEGKTLSALTVAVLGGKAMSATFDDSFTKEDAKK